MNTIFKKELVIQLNNSYTLTPDSDNGIVLTFSEERVREKVEKVGGKKIKTGETEPFTFEDKWYAPTVQQILTRFVEISQREGLKNSNSVEELVTKTDEIYAVIKEFKDKYKNFS